MIAGSLVLIAGAVVLLVAGLGLSSTALLGGSIAASVLAALVLVVGARWSPPGRSPVRHHPHRRRSPARAERRRGAAASASGAYTREGATRGGRAEPPAEDGAARGRPAGGSPAEDRAPAATATIAAPVPAQPGTRAGAPASPDHPPAAGSSQADVGPPEQAAVAGVAGDTSVVDPIDGLDDDAGDLDADPPDEPAPQLVSAADVARVARLTTEVLVVDGRPRYHLAGCVHLLGRQSEPLPVGEAVQLGFTPCSLCEPDSALLADVRRG